MRAGNLDREITIQRVAIALDAYGAPVETWIALVTLRAELLQGTGVQETIANPGASTQQVLAFRTRYFDGITLADRVSYQGTPFALKEIREIGRRRGLELRAERIGPQ